MKDIGELCNDWWTVIRRNCQLRSNCGKTLKFVEVAQMSEFCEYCDRNLQPCILTDYLQSCRLALCLMAILFSHWCIVPLPFTRQHLSHSDSLRDNREDYHHCSVMCHIYNQYMHIHISCSQRWYMFLVARGQFVFLRLVFVLCVYILLVILWLSLPVLFIAWKNSSPNWRSIC